MSSEHFFSTKHPDMRWARFHMLSFRRRCRSAAPGSGYAIYILCLSWIPLLSAFDEIKSWKHEIFMCVFRSSCFAVVTNPLVWSREQKKNPVYVDSCFTFAVDPPSHGRRPLQFRTFYPSWIRLLSAAAGVFCLEMRIFPAGFVLPCVWRSMGFQLAWHSDGDRCGVEEETLAKMDDEKKEKWEFKVEVKSARVDSEEYWWK